MASKNPAASRIVPDVPDPLDIARATAGPVDAATAVAAALAVAISRQEARVARLREISAKRAAEIKQLEGERRRAIMSGGSAGVMHQTIADLQAKNADEAIRIELEEEILSSLADPTVSTPVREAAAAATEAAEAAAAALAKLDAAFMALTSTAEEFQAALVTLNGLAGIPADYVSERAAILLVARVGAMAPDLQGHWDVTHLTNWSDLPVATKREILADPSRLGEAVFPGGISNCVGGSEACATLAADRAADALSARLRYSLIEEDEEL